MTITREKILTRLQEKRQARALPPPPERRRLREVNDVSVRFGADLSETDPTTFWRWESGQVQLRDESIVKYRAFLDAMRELERERGTEAS